MNQKSAPAPEATAEQDLIDLRSLVLIARRRSKVFLLVALLIAIPGIAVLPFLPNQFSSTANVLIDRRKTDVANVEAVLADLPADSASVDTEVQVMKSPAVIRRVVDRLDLAKDPMFNPRLAQPSLLGGVKDSLLSLFGLKKPDQPNLSEVDRVVANVGERIDVSRRGLTYVIGVTTTTPDPVLSARISNAVAEEYISRQVDEKKQAAREALEFVNSKLSGLGNDVNAKEAAAESLRASAGLSGKAGVADYDQQAIQMLSSQAIQLQSELADKRAQLAAAQRARSNPGALSSVIDSPTVRDLKAERAKLIAQASEVSSRYGPLHPQTATIRQQLADVDREISAEMSRIVASLSNDVAAAEGRLASVRGSLAGQRSSAIGSARSEARVAQIEREAQATRSIYEDFLRRSKEADTTEALARANATIVSAAAVPNAPSSPNRPLLAVMVLGLAVAAAAVAVIIAELMDVKLSSGSDVERNLGLRHIASIPAVSRDNEGLPYLLDEKPMSGYSEAFRGLASFLDDERTGARAVMVSSALPHEGKTSVATSLAFSLARSGKRVLLIDADIRRPNVAASLGIEIQAASVPEVVKDPLLFDKHLSTVGAQGVRVFGISHVAENLEVFRNGTFEKLLARVRGSYDYVVIDTPPVLAVSDAQNIAPECDDVVLVCRWRRTSRFAAKAAVSALRAVGAPLTGAVLNGVNPKAQSLYSRDDALVFYRSYKDYYLE